MNRRHEYDPEFEDRIILASYSIEQKRNIFFLISCVFTDLKLPKPQYVLSLVFAVGLAFSIALIQPYSDYGTLIENLYINGELS